MYIFKLTIYLLTAYGLVQSKAIVCIEHVNNNCMY